MWRFFYMLGGEHTWLSLFIDPSSIVWSELGPPPPFPPMRVLEEYWLRALSLVCEVALRWALHLVRENHNEKITYCPTHSRPHNAYAYIWVIVGTLSKISRLFIKNFFPFVFVDIIISFNFASPPSYIELKYSRTTYSWSRLHHESIGCHNFDKVGTHFNHLFLWVVKIRFHTLRFMVSKD